MNTLPEHKIETSGDKFHNLISQAPVLIATFIGPSFIVESVNKMALEVWEKSYEEVINKPLFESSPELEDGLKSLLSAIIITGEPFISDEIPVQLKRLGKPDMAYFNSVYQPLRDADNKIYGIILIGTEITEAVNARKLFETSESLTRSILESSPDCLKVLDLEGRIQYMNYSGLCQMEIDDFSTLKNKYWSTLWGSENEALVKASVDKALAGETAKFTAFCPTAKGTHKWWDVVVSPIRKPGEPVQQIISVSRDITDQKESQEFIDKMASHLKLATDSANVGVWSLNIQSQELEWSALHKKMWGYDEHRTDLTYEDWHKLILPEDKELAFTGVEEARVNHSFYEVEYRINKDDDNGIRFIRSVGTYYYNNKGEAETLTGVSIDITEQKKSQESIDKMASHLKLATDSANVGVWSLNIQTQELEWSALHKKMWGYDEHCTDLTYEDWHKLILPEDKELAFKKVGDARINHTLYEVEYRIKRANDNVIRWMKSVGHYYYNIAGEAVTLTGISIDINEQKESEEKIRRLNISLEEKVKSRTEEIHEKNIQLKKLSAKLQSIREEERKHLAREIHDELGQLASAIKMDVDWLSIKVEGLEAAAKNRIAHANKIIELMITDIRKIASGLRPSVLDHFGLNAALQWHCAEFQNLNGIPCIFDPGFDDKDMLMHTKTELFRMVQESLTNVMRHAKASSVSISTKKDAENIYLIITDNGIGFDSSKMKATLGLIGLEERAATLHGKLQIESSIGKGTVITAIVPKN